MPQMSAFNWLFMFLAFIAALLIIMSKLFNFQLQTITHSLPNSNSTNTASNNKTWLW